MTRARIKSRTLSRKKRYTPNIKKPRSKSRKKPRSKSKSRKKTRSKSKSRKKPRSRSKTSSRKRSRSKSKTIRKKLRRGESANPVTGKNWSSKYLRNTSLRQKVQDLPASQPQVKEDLHRLLDETDILLISGETGSGKTTQVPKLVWEYLNYADTVICTQPRTLTTAFVADRVAKEMDLEIGQEVGFRYRGSDKLKGGDITGLATLVYMTEGTFLNNTYRNPANMAYYGAVIIDEAHDRNIDTDFLMFYIKEVLKTVGLRTKFIIMSATLDKQIFMDYFKDFDIKEYHIPGRTFPVESKFLTQSIYGGLNKSFKIFEAMNNTVTLIIGDIMNKRPKQITVSEDILVFFPSISRIMSFKDELTDYLDKNNFKNFKVLDLSSHTPEDERQSRAQVMPGITKIVLSTPIAETGVTIDGISYVIDSGLAYDSDFDAETRTEILDLNFISQAEVKQRRGRSGRIKPGICYHLYTKEEYQQFRSFKLPQIMRANYDKWILSLFFQFRNQENSYSLVKQVMKLLITPPDNEGFNSTIKYFRKIKLISDELEHNRITELGECFYAMELTTSLSYAFFTGLSYGVNLEIMADLISILEIKSNLGGWFVSALPDEFKEKYMNEYGDLFGIYQIYIDWKSDKIPREFLEYLNLTNFRSIKDKSQMLSGNSTVSMGVICEDAVKPKFKPSEKDMFLNIARVFRQTLPENLVLVKSLELDRFKMKYLNNFISLKDEEEVLALSTLTQKVFGKESRAIYDNFLRIL